MDERKKKYLLRIGIGIGIVLLINIGFRIKHEVQCRIFAKDFAKDAIKAYEKQLEKEVYLYEPGDLDVSFQRASAYRFDEERWGEDAICLYYTFEFASNRIKEYYETAKKEGTLEEFMYRMEDIADSYDNAEIENIPKDDSRIVVVEMHHQGDWNDFAIKDHQNIPYHYEADGYTVHLSIQKEEVYQCELDLEAIKEFFREKHGVIEYNKIYNSGSASEMENPLAQSPNYESSDPYDVNEYDNPDDFADEWAEEFADGDSESAYEDGYDDAYDYWEEEME